MKFATIFLILFSVSLCFPSFESEAVAPVVAKQIAKSKAGKQAAKNIAKKACKGQSKQKCLKKLSQGVKDKAKSLVQKGNKKLKKKLPNSNPLKQSTPKLSQQQLAQRTAQAQKNLAKLKPGDKKSALKTIKSQCKGLSNKQCNKLVKQTLSARTPNSAQAVAKTGTRKKGTQNNKNDSGPPKDQAGNDKHPLQTSNSRKYWTKSTTFKGNKVFQREDLIDPKKVDARGRTNLERMKKGLAPIGPDGKSINLHHMTQRQNGAIAEVSESFHKKNDKIIHINPKSVPTGIDRAAFNKWRISYWKERAKGFQEN